MLSCGGCCGGGCVASDIMGRGGTPPGTAMRRGSTGWPSTRPLQADVTRLVEAGGGARLEALGVQGEAAAASVAARLEGHERELADAVQKRAVLECVPSLLLTALSRVQDCFCLLDPNLPDCLALLPEADRLLVRVSGRKGVGPGRGYGGVFCRCGWWFNQ